MTPRELAERIFYDSRKLADVPASVTYIESLLAEVQMEWTAVQRDYDNEHMVRKFNEEYATQQAGDVANRLLSLRHFDRTVLIRLITKAILACQKG